MSETNDEMPQEDKPIEAAPGVSDDVSETADVVKATPLPQAGETEDVSEAYEETPDEAPDAQQTSAAPEPSPSNGAKNSHRARSEDTDPKPELRQLMELAVKYPEIGPPLAELAFKIGQSDIGERIVRMGLDDDESTGVEFYAVAVDVARREGRFEDVFAQVEDALKTFAETADDAVTEDEANRLLHLVRSGFAVLLFDLEDVNAKPAWTQALAEQLPRLESRYSDDPFYYSLLAQAHWFTDPAKSEEIWQRAVELSDSDFSWNARGTWYKDALKDFEKADSAYREGLKAQPQSALLLHNLAQLLTDEAEQRGEEDADQARGWLREADELVRKALRQQTRRGLRRYIHGTKDRIRNLQSSLPAEHRDPPQVGETVRGRVVALAQYGAFVTIAGGYKGLLHNTEIAHERVNNPGTLFKVGDKIQVKVLSVEPQDDGTLRIGFSRKALLPAPEKGAQPTNQQQQRENGDRGRDRRQQKGKKGKNRGGKSHSERPRQNDGIGSLGEMLLAKLEEAKGQSED